ncbi:MAG: TatD family hydrolase [Planctomycetota bacterium]
MFIDTHAHLDFPDFENDLKEVIANANNVGVHTIINIGTSVESSKKVIEIAHKFDCCYAAIGIHPHDAKDATDEAISALEQLGSDEKVVAIGEVGLDFYRNLSPREIQEKAFRKFLDLADKLDKPVIIHSRDATREALKIIEEGKKPVRGVMHCFASSQEIAKKCFKLGILASCAGQITFPNADSLRKRFSQIPYENIMLETDCPFLAPQKWRGKRCEPAYIPDIAEVFARLYNISVEQIAKTTTENAKRLFGI